MKVRQNNAGGWLNQPAAYTSAVRSLKNCNKWVRVMFSDWWSAYCLAQEDCRTLVGRELEKAAKREAEAILGLAAEPAPDLIAVAQKMSVLQSIIAVGAHWLDARDVLLAASVTADLDRLSALANILS